jgi:FtsH-binding integral membrane protein
MSNLPGGYEHETLEYSTETDSRMMVQFFNTVYAWMAVGLALTAVVAYLCSNTPAITGLLFSNKFLPVAIVLGLFALAWFVQSQIMNLSLGMATALYLTYCAVMGALISWIFIVYPVQTLLAAFLVTGGVFGVFSIVGFVIKKDLTAFGPILGITLLGLFATSILNVFIANNALSWVVTYGVLLVSIGITVWKTQELKMFAHASAGQGEVASKMAIIGSLILYITFINLFLSILRIMGGRR